MYSRDRDPDWALNLNLSNIQKTTRRDKQDLRKLGKRLEKTSQRTLHYEIERHPVRREIRAEQTTRTRTNTKQTR